MSSRVAELLTPIEPLRIDEPLAAAVDRFKSAPQLSLIPAVDEGGMLVVDDFVPCASWPPLRNGRVDDLRVAWLSDERFTSVDVMVAEDTSVLVAVRR